MSKTIKPTVIKIDKDKVDAPRPSVIRTSDAEPVNVPLPSPVTPTVIGVKQVEVNPSQITIKANAEAAEKAPAFVPTKMKGHARERLPVTLADLQRKYPDANEAMATKALQYVVETDVEGMLQTSALIWQTELQKRYSDKVMQLLDCTRHPAIEKTNSHISRIIEILQAIDLHGVCEYERDGVLSKFLKHSNKEFDTPEELDHAEKELKQLTQLLGEQLKALLVLHEKLQNVHSKIAELADEIKATGMAAHFLADYLRKKNTNYERIADQFYERGISLFHTQVQIFETEVSRSAQVAHPAKLIELIQNTILVMIPDWLGSVASIRVMLDTNKKVTITEIEELSDWKKKIIKHLN